MDLKTESPWRPWGAALEWVKRRQVVTGWVYGIGVGSERETLSSRLWWYPSRVGEEWVHQEIDPATWRAWAYRPEWRYRAKVVDGVTKKVGEFEEL